MPGNRIFPQNTYIHAKSKIHVICSANMHVCMHKIKIQTKRYSSL